MQFGTETLSFFYWIPRILAIVFIVFLALFALDVFIPGKTLDYYFVALFMHLIPNFFLAGILLVAWRHEKIGGGLFLLIAIFFTLFFRTYMMFANFLMISLPVLVIGGLFLLHSYLIQTNTRRNI